METLNTINIIPLLKKSQLYKTLTDDSESSITIPKKYVIDNSIINKKTNQLMIKTANNFFTVLDQLRFWMIEELPYEIYDFILYNGHQINTNSLGIKINDFRDFHYDEIKILNTAFLGFGNKTSQLMFLDFDDTIEKIMKHGLLRLLQYLISNPNIIVPMSDTIMITASKYNQFEILKYLYKSISNRKLTFKFHADIIINAAKNENFDMFKWVNKIGCNKNYGICNALGENGNLEMFKYAYENGFEINEYASRNAAKNGHIKILKYMMSVNERLDGSLNTCASRSGNLEMLKFINKYIYSLPNQQIYNNCFLMCWSSTDGITVDINACTHIAYEKKITPGHLECLKYVLDKKCRHCSTYWMEHKHSQGDYLSNQFNNTYFMAALYGHLDIIKILHSYNRPLPKEATAFAAINGHNKIIHWLVEHGCEWDENTDKFAIENAYLNCLRSDICKIDEVLKIE